MKCNGCLKVTSIREVNSIRCSLVPCGKHFCTSCVKISDISQEQRKTWIGPECSAAARRGGDISSTPARGSNAVQVKPNSQGVGQSEVGELVAEVRRLTEELSSVKQRLEETILSLTRCHTRLDEVEAEAASNTSRIQKLEEREKEVIDLKFNVLLLQRELNSQAQAHLKNEMEITGLPESQNENLHHVVLVAARKAGVDLVDGDVDWVSRVGSCTSIRAGQEVKQTRPVVVRFVRKVKRDQMLRKCRSRKNITSTDLEVSGPAVKVYFNDRLTKQNWFLFREARVKSKAHGYAFCCAVKEPSTYASAKVKKLKLFDLLRIYKLFLLLLKLSLLSVMHSNTTSTITMFYVVILTERYFCINTILGPNILTNMPLTF